MNMEEVLRTLVSNKAIITISQSTYTTLEQEGKIDPEKWYLVETDEDCIKIDNYQETILWEGNQYDNGIITLNDNVNNYKFIELYGGFIRGSSFNYIGMTKIRVEDLIKNSSGQLFSFGNYIDTNNFWSISVNNIQDNIIKIVDMKSKGSMYISLYKVVGVNY